MAVRLGAGAHGGRAALDHAEAIRLRWVPVERVLLAAEER